MPSELFDLSPHGVDVHVGVGPSYPWGGLYGGQIVAQALRAAALTVEHDAVPHSIRAYFIRPGDPAEPVRYEVDRIRNGRSFATRRVVARQAIGAILNAESSFQRPEEAADLQTVQMPAVPQPDVLTHDSWTAFFDRAFVPLEMVEDAGRDGSGRVVVWARATEEIGDPAEPDAQVRHRCWLAYVSDDFPADSVERAHPDFDGEGGETDPDQRSTFVASLDHTIWFHHPVAADRWLLYDVSCHHFVGGRGLAVGHVFAEDGTHVATIAQEVLMRSTRRDA